MAVSLVENNEVRQLAIALRDKYLADARQAMKVVRQIEKAYDLVPANKTNDNNQRS